jgi:hypothetical protein
MAFSLSSLSPKPFIASLAARRLSKVMAEDAKNLEKMAAKRAEVLATLERNWRGNETWTGIGGMFEKIAFEQEGKRQDREVLPRTLTPAHVLMNLIRKGGLADPEQGVPLASNREFLEYLHAALPFEGFVEAARHAPDGLRQEALGWALFSATDAASAQRLLDEGANPDVAPAHLTVVNNFGYLGLARFPETLPAFRAALVRNKTWMFEHLTGASPRHPRTDVFLWLMQEGCPEALGVALEEGYEPRRFLDTVTPFGHVHFHRSLGEGGNPMEFLVRRFRDMNDDQPGLAQDLERVRVLNEHDIEVLPALSDDAPYNLLVYAAGNPKHINLSSNGYLSDRAPNQVIEALYPLSLADNQTHWVEQMVRYSSFAWHGDPEQWEEKEKMGYSKLLGHLENGARLTGMMGGRDPLLLGLLKNFDSPSHPSFDALFERFVPAKSRQRLLNKLVREAENPTVTRWALEKGMVPDFANAGFHYSTARILSREPNRAVFVQMVKDKIVDLDGLTFEAGKGREQQAPLAIQILRFEGPDILPDLMDAGWNPNRLFVVDGAELSLAQIMALPQECKNRHAASDRISRDLGLAFSDMLASHLMEAPLKKWSDILIERFAVLERCGVNLSLTGSAESRTADQLLGEGVKGSNKDALELLIHSLREKLKVLIGRDHLNSTLRQAGVASLADETGMAGAAPSGVDVSKIGRVIRGNPDTLTPEEEWLERPKNRRL